MNPIQDLTWRNLNALRKYPFSDSSAMFFKGGALPSNWILDARIYANGQRSAVVPTRIGRLIRASDSIFLVVMVGERELGAAEVRFGDIRDLIALTKDGVPAGCLVVDPDRSALLQSIPEGDYLLPAGVADFLPSCVEPLPARQVTSLAEASGKVLLSAEEGISLTKVDGSTIRIDISGDPHSGRYECVSEDGSPSEGNQALDLRGVFLEQLTVLHYVKNSQGQLAGPFASKLQGRSDGSVALVLKTPVYSDVTGEELRDLRPAFRITVEGGSVTFSMAGGS